MIPKECKRLAEVDFPIAMVSKHAVAENAVRHGHPKTLHLWWARRPLAACRAMLLGLLLPDPCDEQCPEDFKHDARKLLPKMQGQVGPKDKQLQKSLLKFIGDFANWDLSSDRTYLEVSRGLVKAAHPEETPLVVDPFAGGGSIPIEGLRLGCETFASDINPVACLILKVMLEDIPQHGPALAEELRRVGAEIKKQATIELAELYPKDLDGATGEGMREEEDEDLDDEAENAPKKKKKGLTLVFDVARRFAQPLGIHLDNWEDRIIETDKGIVRLLPVGERGAQLFGQDGTDLVAERLEREPASTFQLTLFPDKTEAAPKVKGKRAKAKKGSDKDLRTSQEATTLDRVHAAMLLQASGRTNGLRALLKAEQERGPDFLRLANALSALYPRESEEKRLLDAMLLAVPR